jgi:hypothetical protein
MDGARVSEADVCAIEPVPDEYGSKFYRNSAHGGGSAARAAVGTVTPTLLVVGVPRHIARVPPSIDHQPAISAKPTMASVIP